ncbi:ATP-binding protein [Paraburkholderia sp. UCT31]|uniref:ATP-dependent nuclease n=1 Tax=Paraburkholderia sp. UCT31 TaxID=2615209 RepID=UPI001655E373|nr:AAA family ATPase [Paraburkholderia sp. UCT31]MBC8737572.1 ATP-binding protein [Paraburkholderia sp. UCT31]
MEIFLQIENVQHIVSACVAVPFDGNQLFCIVGRNGVGKTSIVKALRNLHVSDTYKITSDEAIFSEKSRIVYRYNQQDFEFTYDSKIRGLNSKSVIPSAIREEIEVELPMPYGERFNYFQTISNHDAEIRQNVVLENYARPDELIEFLSDIYGSRRFENLREIDVNGRTYYCLVKDDSRYIREDYFSSGEYFVISLYRKIRNKRKLIIIDEIDISLDAAAQVHLVRNLRSFCQKYKVNIVFTTHSLAMMRMLEPEELLYVENNDGNVEHRNASYNYVRGRLFGFSGWDRYILTEDLMLKKFLEHIIAKRLSDTFFTFKIIHVGAAANTVDLMKRNAHEHYFSETDKVLSILDGDQVNEKYVKNVKEVLFLPFASVEKEVFIEYAAGNLKPLPTNWKSNVSKADGKGLFLALHKAKLYSTVQLFEHLCLKYTVEIEKLINDIDRFLNPSAFAGHASNSTNEPMEALQMPGNVFDTISRASEYLGSLFINLSIFLKTRGRRP